MLGTSLPMNITPQPTSMRQAQLRSLDPLSLENDADDWEFVSCSASSAAASQAAATEVPEDGADNAFVPEPPHCALRELRVSDESLPEDGDDPGLEFFEFEATAPRHPAIAYLRQEAVA